MLTPDQTLMVVLLGMTLLLFGLFGVIVYRAGAKADQNWRRV